MITPIFIIVTIILCVVVYIQKLEICKLQLHNKKTELQTFTANEDMKNINTLLTAFYSDKTLYTEYIAINKIEKINFVLHKDFFSDRLYSKICKIYIQEKGEVFGYDYSITPNTIFFLSEEERKQYLIDKKLKEVNELMK